MVPVATVPLSKLLVGAYISMTICPRSAPAAGGRIGTTCAACTYDERARRGDTCGDRLFRICAAAAARTYQCGRASSAAAAAARSVPYKTGNATDRRQRAVPPARTSSAEAAFCGRRTAAARIAIDIDHAACRYTCGSCYARCTKSAASAAARGDDR